MVPLPGRGRGAVPAAGGRAERVHAGRRAAGRAPAARLHRHVGAAAGPAAGGARSGPLHKSTLQACSRLGAAAGPAAGREGFTGPMRTLLPQAVLAQLQAVALEACARQAVTISVALHRDILYESCNDNQMSHRVPADCGCLRALHTRCKVCCGRAERVCGPACCRIRWRSCRRSAWRAAPGRATACSGRRARCRMWPRTARCAPAWLCFCGCATQVMSLLVPEVKACAP